jgi:nitrite reductase/ring-hydroxylating ferredoxin subunit
MTLLALGPANGRRSWTIESSDGRRFAVFAVGGERYVSDALCPHNRGPLVEGWVREEDRMLICPWHWFRFDLRTGRCGVHRRYDLTVYPVVERDGEHYADIGEAAAKRSWSDILRSHARQES